MGTIYSLLSDTLWPPISQNQMLFKAIRDNDYIKLENMIRSGADVTNLNEEGLTLMHYSAELGRQQCIQTLIFYNSIDINIRDQSETPMGPLQSTPLHLAAAEGWPQLVVYLIDNGADINAVTITGWTPLQYLMITEHMTPGKLESLAVLIGMGADVNRRDTNGNHAVNIAVLYGHYEATRLLLNSGINGELVEPIDPNCLKTSRVFDCVELCVMAGISRVIEKYDFVKYLMENCGQTDGSNEDEDSRKLLLNKIDSLLTLKISVKSLKHLCRLSVRRLYANQNLNQTIDRLSLPHSLRWYLLMIELSEDND